LDSSILAPLKCEIVKNSRWQTGEIIHNTHKK